MNTSERIKEVLNGRRDEQESFAEDDDYSAQESAWRTFLNIPDSIPHFTSVRNKVVPSKYVQGYFAYDKNPNGYYDAIDDTWASIANGTARNGDSNGQLTNIVSGISSDKNG